MTLSPRTPLWSAARELLAGRVADFAGRWQKVRKGFDPEDIHDLRVSSRRLREGLALFEPLYPPPALDRAVRRVRKVTRLLGAMRNTDEALVFFRELAAEPDVDAVEGLELLVARYGQLRDAERARLEEGLRQLDFDRMRNVLERTVATPRLFVSSSVVDPFVHLADFAAESLRARCAEVLELVPAACSEENVEAQHALRIAVKHWRYRLELLSFLLGGGFGEMHGTVKGYQEVLGKMHDLDVFAGIVREAGLPSEAGYVILNAIAERRRSFFARFAGMLAAHPPETIGEQVRATL